MPHVEQVAHCVLALAEHGVEMYSPVGHDEHEAHWVLARVVQADEMYWEVEHAEHAVQTRSAFDEQAAD